MKEDKHRQYTYHVYKNTRTLLPRNRRHKRITSRSKNSHIIIHLLPTRPSNNFLLRINTNSLIIQQQLNVILLIPRSASLAIKLTRHGERGRIARFEVGSELDAIVCRAGLLAEGGDGTFLGGIEIEEIFHEALSNHSVADDYDALFVAVGGFMELCGFL